MKNKINTIKKTNGFTLIELIVVIAIIGILIGIAVPQYNKFIGQAQFAKQDADAKTLYTAYMAAIAIDPNDAANGLPITNELAGPNLAVSTAPPSDGLWHIDVTTYPPNVLMLAATDESIEMIFGNQYYMNGVRIN